jgi:hypothetical protein
MGRSIRMRDGQVIITASNKNRIGKLYVLWQLTELYFN